MNEEIKPIIAEMKEILNKYPDRQPEILLYVFGRDNLMRIINEPTYEQLQQENQHLKKDLSKTINMLEKVYKNISGIYNQLLIEIGALLEELEKESDVK